jgi:hypothetical protein
MKTLFTIIQLFCITIIVNSCDYVSNTIEPNSNNGGGNQITDTTKVYRKVLIEDYTGHRCGNCPAAARTLKRIDSIYHGKIVPLAIHCTNFANPNVTYPEDFRTAEGTEYDNVLGVSASSGLPNGLVNRKGFGTPNFVKADAQWESEAQTYFNQEADFKIELNNSYNSTFNSFNSEVKVTALKDLSGEYNVTLLLIEDSIIGVQYDQSLPVAQQVVTNYKFMHVLRKSINTAWGEQAFNGTITKNQSFTKTFSNVSLNSGYNPGKCQVIAFIYDAATSSTTRYEVFQVEMEKIK